MTTIRDVCCVQHRQDRPSSVGRVPVAVPRYTAGRAPQHCAKTNLPCPLFGQDKIGGTSVASGRGCCSLSAPLCPLVPAGSTQGPI